MNLKDKIILKEMLDIEVDWSEPAEAAMQALNDDIFSDIGEIAHVLLEKLPVGYTRNLLSILESEKELYKVTFVSILSEKIQGRKYA